MHYSPAISDMRDRLHIMLYALAVFIATCIAFLGWTLMPESPRPDGSLTAAAAVSSPFEYRFKVRGTLYEAGSMEESTSPYWWLNSGGKLIITGSSGMTVQGALPSKDRWHSLYQRANPLDSDLGTHPQNLFRLVSRSTWDDVRLTAYFRVERDNVSDSPNRNASNGLLLMSRYAKDGQSLYYAGVRVDGTAVIKKKKRGAYTTLAQETVFDGAYGGSGSANLIPHGEWIGLRSETETLADGSVRIRLLMKREGGTWREILSARDASPVTGPAYVGIRTDFMDVSFRDYAAESL